MASAPLRRAPGDYLDRAGGRLAAYQVLRPPRGVERGVYQLSPSAGFVQGHGFRSGFLSGGKSEKGNFPGIQENLLDSWKKG